VSRDREDELASIARKLKTRHTTDLERQAVVFSVPCRRPLSHAVFAGAGVPYQTSTRFHSRPSRTAAPIRVRVRRFNFTRTALVALLGSPHFRFEADGGELRRSGG
jgi:hypothetical protein